MAGYDKYLENWKMFITHKKMVNKKDMLSSKMTRRDLQE
jgi:hypothetical protein